MPDLAAPAHKLRDALRVREIGAFELTRAALARIAALNPALNAVVTLDETGAMQAALESERRIAAREARPLEGLPITIKDALDVAGMVSTAGLPGFKARVPEEDASVVARLRAAGAVILGKTNVPVFSGDFQSVNPIHGVTNNPWDATRSPGGSSGGAAVAVATGMAAFEVGTDLGSSIRWPAHATGVFGLKTTWGLVSTWGMIPPPPDRRPPRNVDLVVAGPIARSSADLAMALEVMAGPREAGFAATPLKPARATSANGLRVALLTHDPFGPLDAEMVEGVKNAAKMLAGQGAIITEIARPPVNFAEAYEVFALLNHMVVAYGLPHKVRARIQAQAASFAPGDLSHRALQARGAAIVPGAYQAIQMRRMALKRQWARFFTQYDALLCPPAPVLAIPHNHTPDVFARVLTIRDASGRESTRPYLDFLVWASLATGADLPAAVAPVDRAASGLPRGVQIICAEGEDMSAVAVAGMIEVAGGGYSAPPFQA
ncbi:MAG: amidase family protein [Bosea sp. (in: a-proteobacteria)]